MPTPDPQDALKALVEDAKQKKKAKAKADGRKRYRANIARAEVGKVLMRTSLAQVHWAWPAVKVLGIFAAASFPVLLLLSDENKWAALMPSALGSLAPTVWFCVSILMIILWILFFLYFIDDPVKGLFARRELKWLNNLPYALGLPGYLDCLYKEWGIATLQLNIHFATPVSPDMSKLMAQAASAKEPGIEKTAWSSDRTVLTLQSKTLTTSSFTVGRTGAVWTYSNRNVHKAFRKFMENVVPLLAATHPVASLDVGVLGSPGGR